MAILSTLSVADTGINQIDSLLYGTKWGSNAVTFSFPAVRSDWTGYYSGSEPYSNFIGLNSMQQDAARSALAGWSNVCNLNFTETTGGTGVIRFGTSSLPSTSWAYYPSRSEVGGDVWFEQ
jgi:serralysin